MSTTVAVLGAHESRFCVIRALAGLLLRVCRNGACAEKRFHWLRLLLETSPLTSGESALAVNRLNNGRRYLLEGEPGASYYELHLLLSSLVAPSNPSAACRVV